MSTTEKHIEVKASSSSFEQVMNFLREQLSAAGCPEDVIDRISIASEEIFVNVASYAYSDSEVANSSDKVMVSCSIDDDTHEVDITFIDQGTPYNPLAHKDPDITTPTEEREIGGLGIFMVKNMMDDVEYSHDGQNNRLVIRKGWSV